MSNVYRCGKDCPFYVTGVPKVPERCPKYLVGVCISKPAVSGSRESESLGLDQKKIPWEEGGSADGDELAGFELTANAH